MNIYKLSHVSEEYSKDVGYLGDCEAVELVVARTENDAFKYWRSPNVSLADVTVELIGTASEGINPGRLCGSVRLLNNA
ncbi:hypothetical protein SAMN05216428_11294 [Nitrosospira sp. Nsp11]|uniref:hypothetical protein n=1 Tax=Nitrosospira sp. Nsp11 TaxID=1855338 RepID=UPI000915DEF3|nr:hypothetical protein [Nitrosospira sp. Nsp11]SHM05606.1 hypothetical protein SAMN05216428_11294 [Nitrosospira sp. Nsp11]